MPVHIDPLGGAPLPIIDVACRPRRVILIGVDAGSPITIFGAGGSPKLEM